MDICIIGAGYVGLTSAAVLAHLGHHIICVDKNKVRVEQLNSGKVPIYEPGLQELLEANQERLLFTDHIQEAARSCPVILVAVGTPSLPNGEADVSHLYTVIQDISSCLTAHKTILIKSTVPPGTNKRMTNTLLQLGIPRHLFSIVSNPEFLREGSALFDMLHPDKTVIGVEPEDAAAVQIVQEMYNGIPAPFFVTNVASAELIKYANNAFLAAKISFINEISRICDAYEADVTAVAKGIGLDPRIGSSFLQAGIGYGGSCFPKDVSALMHAASSHSITPHMLQAAQAVNDTQVQVYVDKLQEYVPHAQSSKIGVLGISFKPNTDDTRYSPALKVIHSLAAAGYTVHAYDPIARLPKDVRAPIVQQASLEAVVQAADCLFIATDWDMFKTLDWKRLKDMMKGTIIVDGRNCISKKLVEQHGFTYVGVGRL